MADADVSAPRSAPPLIPLAVTAAWLTAATVLLRWWDVTLRVEGFPLWTALFTALYAGALPLLARHGLGPARRPWSDVWLWLGLIAALTLLPLLVPRLTLPGTTLQTVALLRVFDLVLPLWILVRGVAIAWSGRRRLAATLAVPAYLLLVFWGFAVRMPGASHEGGLPPLTELERGIRDGAERHVRALADGIGSRGAARYEAAVAAADHLVRELEALGYDVREQRYRAGGREHRNLEVALPGTARPEEIVVVGAHYDSHDLTPGADDNATGVAGVLELARLLAGRAPERTVRLVLFGTEEPPFFNTDEMGSRVYAAAAAEAGERVVAMFALEMLGRFDDAPGSQSYPPPLQLFYPERGDFVAMVGNPPSARLLRRSLARFRETTPLPSEGMVAPSMIPGVELSDHASFWRRGYPALSISDTGPFRNRDYHTPGDTAGAIDYGRMARVVAGVLRVVEDAAGFAPRRSW